MNIQIARRIRAAEKTVAALHRPARQPKVMFFPVGGDDEDVARYQAEVAQAVRDGFFVIQIVPLKPKGAMQ
jgi:hypothetical protein